MKCRSASSRAGAGRQDPPPPWTRPAAAGGHSRNARPKVTGGASGRPTTRRLTRLSKRQSECVGGTERRARSRRSSVGAPRAGSGMSAVAGCATRAIRRSAAVTRRGYPNRGKPAARRPTKGGALARDVRLARFDLRVIREKQPCVARVTAPLSLTAATGAPPRHAVDW
jgi:hypothetical protein